MTKFTDVFLYALVPLVAGLLAIVVARTRKANTYSPILALGLILVGASVLILVSVLILSVFSMVK